MEVGGPTASEKKRAESCTFSLSIEERHVDVVVAGSVSQTFRRLAGSHQAIGGNISWDRVAAPFETAHGIQPTADRDDRRWTRGYDWGTLLNAQHVAALGGKAAVLASCPAGVVDDLSERGETLIHLQLGDDPRAVTPEQYVRLREYLRPVLNPTERRGVYFGPPLLTPME
jgi:hypothetical protein